MITFLLKSEFNTVIKLELCFPGRILRVESLNMKCKTDISKTKQEFLFILKIICMLPYMLRPHSLFSNILPAI